MLKNGDINILEIWKNAQELERDISLVKSAFESWISTNSNSAHTNETLSSQEDAAFEELCELYGTEQASIKLGIILDKCFTSAEQEGGGWKRGI